MPKPPFTPSEAKMVEIGDDGFPVHWDEHSKMNRYITLLIAQYAQPAISTMISCELMKILKKYERLVGGNANDITPTFESLRKSLYMIVYHRQLLIEPPNKLFDLVDKITMKDVLFHSVRGAKKAARILLTKTNSARKEGYFDWWDRWKLIRLVGKLTKWLMKHEKFMRQNQEVFWKYRNMIDYDNYQNSHSWSEDEETFNTVLQMMEARGQYANEVTMKVSAYDFDTKTKERLTKEMCEAFDHTLQFKERNENALEYREDGTGS